MRLPRTLKAGKSWNDQEAAICFIIHQVEADNRKTKKRIPLYLDLLTF